MICDFLFIISAKGRHCDSYSYSLFSPISHIVTLDTSSTSYVYNVTTISYSKRLLQNTAKLQHISPHLLPGIDYNSFLLNTRIHTAVTHFNNLYTYNIKYYYYCI